MYHLHLRFYLIVQVLYCTQTYYAYNTIPPTTLDDRDEKKSRTFAKLMFQGKVRAALRLLSHTTHPGVLSLNQEINGKQVREILKDKHPPAQSAHSHTLLPESAQSQKYHPILFDSINGQLMRSVCLRVQGSAGSSGLDAAYWRRMCTAFNDMSRALCDALAALTKRICTSIVDPSGLSAFIACRLIPLNKQPGVRPIGICEVIRRIVSKAILSVTRSDIQSAVGALQLCAGQDGGCEAAIHGMKSIFEDEECEGALLIDANNAFNSLNRATTLYNVQNLCPSIATALINIYRSNAELFVDNEVILSKEGTTQGDPLAMAMYALGVTPLIQAVCSTGVKQIWFADDASAGGHISQLRSWWDRLATVGPDYGYFVNNNKTSLVVKKEYHMEAEKVFEGTGIHITHTGQRHLGAALGSKSFTEEFVREKVKTWKTELDTLSQFAKTEPHAAFSAFIHGLKGQWTYLLRTVEGMTPLLQPLEDTIRQSLLPALTGKCGISDIERELLALPAHLGGLGLVNPTTMSEEHTSSKHLTAPLTSIIVTQSGDFEAARQAQQATKSILCRDRRIRLDDRATNLKTRLHVSTPV